MADEPVFFFKGAKVKKNTRGLHAGSPRLASKASRSPQRRKTAGLIVDVANVVHEDLRGQHVMLVSTGKTLRYRLANPETLPSVREGTEWLVLDVPSSNAVTGKRSGGGGLPSV